MFRAYRKSVVFAVLFLLSLSLALLGVNGVIPMGRVPALFAVNAALGNIFFFSLFWLIPSERRAARAARGVPTSGTEAETRVPTEQVAAKPGAKNRGRAVAVVAGLCWMAALAGPFVPVQLEVNHIFDFWGFGDSGAVLCSAVWFFIGIFVSLEVSRWAIRKGSSRGAIAANAFLTLIAGFAVLAVLLSVGWGRK